MNKVDTGFPKPLGYSRHAAALSGVSLGVMSAENVSGGQGPSFSNAFTSAAMRLNSHYATEEATDRAVC